MSDLELQQVGLVQEEAPSLADLAMPEEGAGAWAAGWYRATIVEGYTTGRGKVMETSDQSAKDPSSRNLFVCLALDGEQYVPSSADPTKRTLQKGPGGTRNMRATFNYRSRDLSAERIAEVQAGRERYAKVQGAWPDRALQASSLSLGRLGQLQTAVGFKLPFDGSRFQPTKFVSHQVEVRLIIGEKGFNEPQAFAVVGKHVK
jgi:hypothetical protein